MVKVLLEKGADMAIETKHGTAIQIAEQQGHGEVAALLRGWRG